MRVWLHNKTAVRAVACALGVAGLLGGAAAHAQAVYLGSLGTTPAAQGWSAFVPFPASESVSAGAVTLDTMVGGSLQAGYSYGGLAIDSGAGFTLSFTTQLVSESHASGNRAGFSVILLDSAHQGIELGFWTDQVWAQEVGFTKAESALFNTTAMTDFLLNLHNGAYLLWANGVALLSGAMRDYSAFGLPYSLANFLFMGDDTTSAKAQVKIASVGVLNVPTPPTWALLPAGLLALKKKQRRKPA